MMATDAVKDDTPLSSLSSILVTGSNIGKSIANNIANGAIVHGTRLNTCGELAEATVEQVKVMKIKSFLRLLELHTALRHHLRPYDV